MKEVFHILSCDATCFISILRPACERPGSKDGEAPVKSNGISCMIIQEPIDTKEAEVDKVLPYIAFQMLCMRGVSENCIENPEIVWCNRFKECTIDWRKCLKYMFNNRHDGPRF